MTITARCAVALIVFVVPVWGACGSDSTRPDTPTGVAPAPVFQAASAPPIPVSGSVVLFAASAVIHSEEATGTGMIQRSSVAGLTTGDMSGSLLFHPTSVFDFANGTLVNTGTQFFAGTIAGSDPVVLHDDQFRFDIDLNTGATTGRVLFTRSKDAAHPGGWFECDLTVVGTGISPEGDITSDYSGVCVRRGNVR